MRLLWWLLRSRLWGWWFMRRLLMRGLFVVWLTFGMERFFLTVVRLFLAVEGFFLAMERLFLRIEGLRFALGVKRFTFGLWLVVAILF